MFAHERLDVYPLELAFELAFVEWVTDLLEEINDGAGAASREVRDQLDRASLSLLLKTALLNTAEGNGKRQKPVRARFFDDARGSATECAACLEALVGKRRSTEARDLLNTGG